MLTISYNTQAQEVQAILKRRSVPHAALKTTQTGKAKTMHPKLITHILYSTRSGEQSVNLGGSTMIYYLSKMDWKLPVAPWLAASFMENSAARARRDHPEAPASCPPSCWARPRLLNSNIPFPEAAMRGQSTVMRLSALCIFGSESASKNDWGNGEK